MNWHLPSPTPITGPKSGGGAGGQRHHLCAGADLKAFAGEVQSSHSSIPEPPEPVRLGDVFADLHKPCIARVHASVYAGGFLLMAGCTHVIAASSATFSLPK
jgi:enoyl-CoA hydratase/carnithine racemase